MGKLTDKDKKKLFFRKYAITDALKSLVEKDGKTGFICPICKKEGIIHRYRTPVGIKVSSQCKCSDTLHTEDQKEIDVLSYGLNKISSLIFE